MAPRIIILAGLIAICGPVAGSAQVAPFGGGFLDISRVSEPYSDPCDFGSSTAAGAGAYAGVERGALQVTARYAAGRIIGAPACAFDPAIFEDGVYEFRGYTRERSGALHMLSLRAGYAPSVLRIATLYGGAGWETADGDPLLLAGVAVRTAGRLRAIAGAEALWLRARYEVTEEEWRDYVPVRRTVIEDGREWRQAIDFWIGAEYTFGR